MKTRILIASWIISIEMVLGAESIVGVGMALGKGDQGGAPKITDVLPAGPAAKAGIQAGWILLSINGTNTASRSLSECVNLVRGDEGTRVRLELVDPAHKRTNKVTLTRAKILARP
jgi:carboxyl-terminal processing protease